MVMALQSLGDDLHQYSLEHKRFPEPEMFEGVKTLAACNEQQREALEQLYLLLQPAGIQADLSVDDIRTAYEKMGLTCTDEIKQHIMELNTGRYKGSTTLVFKNFVRGIIYEQGLIFKTLYCYEEETIPGIISSPTKNPLRSTTAISEENEEEDEQAHDAPTAQSPTAQTSATRAVGQVDEEFQPPFLVERPDQFKPPTLTVHVYTGKGLETGNMMMKRIDPAVEITLGGNQKTTQTARNSKTPSWDEDVIFESPDLTQELALSVVNNSSASKNFGGRELGNAKYSLSNLANFDPVHLTLDVPMTRASGKTAEVKLSLMYRNEYTVWAEKEREARRARDASPLKSLTRLRSTSASEERNSGSDSPPNKCCIVS